MFFKVRKGQNVNGKFYFSRSLIELVPFIPNMYILLRFDQILTLKPWKYMSYKNLKWKRIIVLEEYMQFRSFPPEMSMAVRQRGGSGE